MMKLQQQFAEILQEKRDLVGIGFEAVKRWRSGKASPTLHTFEKVCEENDIELPFFFDGKIETLIEFNKKVAAEKGLKIQIIFE